MNPSERRRLLLGYATRYPKLREVSSVEEARAILGNAIDDLGSSDIEIFRSFTDHDLDAALEEVAAQFRHIRQYGM